jgi:hypothetical protein
MERRPKTTGAGAPVSRLIATFDVEHGFQPGAQIFRAPKSNAALPLRACDDGELSGTRGAHVFSGDTNIYQAVDRDTALCECREWGQHGRGDNI